LQNVILDGYREIRQVVHWGKKISTWGPRKLKLYKISKLKEDLIKEYIWRFRTILKSELNAKNKIATIGALAVPVLRFGLA
jgi:hypothetical protein